MAGASQTACLADAGNTGSGMECRITTHLHSQLHECPRKQQRWREFHSGDRECPQLKPERWKVQAEQLYGFQDLHLSPANMPAATGHLTKCSSIASGSRNTRVKNYKSRQWHCNDYKSGSSSNKVKPWQTSTQLKHCIICIIYSIIYYFSPVHTQFIHTHCTNAWWSRCKTDLNSFPSRKLDETTGTSSYYTDENHSAGSEIRRPQYGQRSWLGLEPSTLEIDVYVRHYALLVVLARNDDDDTQFQKKKYWTLGN